MSRRLVIIGNGQMAEVFCSQFMHSSDYRVAGLAVDQSLIRSDSCLGLPLVPLEEVESRFPPESAHAFVAIGPIENNAIRAAGFKELRNRGYRFANFSSPTAVVSPDASLGVNVALGHFSVVSPRCKLGDNLLIGSTSNIGHHCQMGSHAFLADPAVIAGSVVVGERAFIGVGVSVRDNFSTVPALAASSALVPQFLATLSRTQSMCQKRPRNCRSPLTRSAFRAASIRTDCGDIALWRCR